MFYKKDTLKNFAKFTGKHWFPSLFLIKLQASAQISSTVIFEKIRLSVKIKLESLLLNFNKLMLVGDFYSDVKYLLRVINKNSTL